LGAAGAGPGRAGRSGSWVKGGSVSNVLVTEVAATAEGLRSLLASVSARELVATPAGRHWLAGAIAALDVVGQPHTQMTSQPRRTLCRAWHSWHQRAAGTWPWTLQR